MNKTQIEKQIEEKIMQICKGEKKEQQFEKLKEKFIKLYNKIEDEFDSDYMKQKYVFNVLANRYARMKYWVLNQQLGIKNYWEIEQ